MSELTQTLKKEVAGSVEWKFATNDLLNTELRDSAIQLLSETAFPTTRDEFWKYTRVTKIRNGKYADTGLNQLQSIERIDPNSILLVFENGHFNAQLSDSNYPDGMKVLPLSKMDEIERHVLGTELPEVGDVFQAFNTAYTTDGLYVHVSAKTTIEKPVEIKYITTAENALSQLRLVIICEAFSSLEVIEQYVTLSSLETSTFTNVVKDIRVAKNAQLTVHTLQTEGAKAHQVATSYVHQSNDSTFTQNTITLNGELVRNNATIFVDGSNCETNLNGAYLLKDNQHVDNHTIVDHLKPHCESNELYKGVLNGSSTAVFNGKVYVRKDAQKINAFQSNGNVLLSDTATVNSKPELEIYADDVKCSHGSTTGQIDDEAIFYLRARGLSEQSAKQLMVGAFIGEVIDKISNQHVVNAVHTELHTIHGWDISVID